MAWSEEGQQVDERRCVGFTIMEGGNHAIPGHSREWDEHRTRGTEPVDEELRQTTVPETSETQTEEAEGGSTDGQPEVEAELAELPTMTEEEAIDGSDEPGSRGDQRRERGIPPNPEGGDTRGQEPTPQPHIPYLCNGIRGNIQADEEDDECNSDAIMYAEPDTIGSGILFRIPVEASKNADGIRAAFLGSWRIMIDTTLKKRGSRMMVKPDESGFWRNLAKMSGMNILIYEEQGCVDTAGRSCMKLVQRKSSGYFSEKITSTILLFWDGTHYDPLCPAKDKDGIKRIINQKNLRKKPVS
ncbi:MAG: hypothetical protein LBT03_01585 [Holosporales bacterium]|nr:hypothetical protein [Holosporales bacterium]